MRLRHIAAVTTLVLAGTLLSASPATSRPEKQRAADPNNHFPASIETTVPPGGSSSLTSPSLPANATQATVTVAAQPGATAEELAEFTQFTGVTGKLTKGQRLMTCLRMHTWVSTSGGETDSDMKFRKDSQTLALLLLAACLEAAGLINQQVQPRASDRTTAGRAGPRCRGDYNSFPAEVKKRGSGYRIDVDGPEKKSPRPKLKVTCKATASGVVYKFKASKKGVPLTRVAGPTLALGLLSPSDATQSVPLKVTFDAK